MESTAQTSRVGTRGTRHVSSWGTCWRRERYVFFSGSCSSIVLRLYTNQIPLYTLIYTICPRRLDPFYIVSYYIKLVNTFWTYSMYYKLDFPPLFDFYLVIFLLSMVSTSLIAALISPTVFPRIFSHFPGVNILPIMRNDLWRKKFKDFKQKEKGKLRKYKKKNENQYLKL